MKTKYVILSIVAIIIMGLWLGGAGILNTGLHPIGIIALPLYVINSIINPEFSGICHGDCGPCWQYGDEHLVIEGQCKIPRHIEECRDGHGGKDVTFLNDKCELKYPVTIRENPQEKVNPCGDFTPEHLWINGVCKIPRNFEECELGHDGNTVRFFTDKNYSICELRDTIVTLD